VFGWEFQHFPQFDYWMISTGDQAAPGINGGMNRRRGPKPQPGQALNAHNTVIDVPSIDSYLQQALAAGATLALAKQTVPGVGYTAYIMDPDGNLVGMHQSDPSAR
jgi:hypothetical protein